LTETKLDLRLEHELQTAVERQRSALPRFFIRLPTVSVTAFRQRRSLLARAPNSG